MRAAVYNSVIPNNIRKTVNRASRLAFGFRVVLHSFVLILGFANRALAADWSLPEQQLAQKIVGVTGPGSVSLTVENRSSLSKRESEIVGNGLHSALEALGLRLVTPEQAAATVAISLSENPTAYVWVAEIHQGKSETAIAIVSIARAGGVASARDSVPLSIRKIPLWAQDDRILDVAVLEENTAPTRMAVLGPEDVSIYRLLGGKWQREQVLTVVHARPWPRDLRGRLVPGKDHLLDAYLPGMICHTTNGTPPVLNCQESDDRWPLVAASLSNGTSANFPSFGSSPPPAVPQVGAFFAASRNFFTGALAPGVGNFKTVPKFYSAAFLPREKSVLWLFAAVDGQILLIDGATNQPARLRWGSDIVSLRTACGAGWQVLATSSGAASSGVSSSDSIRAYESPDRDPVPVSGLIEFAGTVTALWAEARGDTAIAVTRHGETGGYEAFRVAVDCN
ncbi:MAG TPA: hypothetical protein VKR60_02690 [Candidatus Sulfotelmatobacter sp.]|nr:hypothetical protein [Candidatus Sulfotelmatobacter sp.]